MKSIWSAITGNAHEVSRRETEKTFEQVLHEGETVRAGFRWVRDRLALTTQRIILLDLQGVTGRKQAYHSIPWKSVERWTVETAGELDLDGELEIWLRGASQPVLELKFDRSVPLGEIDRIISEGVFGLTAAADTAAERSPRTRRRGRKQDEPV